VRCFQARSNAGNTTSAYLCGPPLLVIGCLLIYYNGNPRIRGLGWRRRRWRSRLLFGAGCGCVAGGVFCFGLPLYYQDCDNYGYRPQPHGTESVTQKYLTNFNYRNTLIVTANVLQKDKQAAIIGALAEGSSIRSIERITGVHRDTIMRLGVRVGNGCEMLMDSKMQDLGCRYLQFDELWGFMAILKSS